MQAIEISAIRWETHQEELSRIRTRVFVEEQQVPQEDEWDNKDQNAVHFLVTDAQHAIGCARLLEEPIDGVMHYHIGRVAILEPWRGRGIGFQLMLQVLEYCHQTAASYPIYLHAQYERQGFYETLGFVAQGGLFMDAGIPHITMYYTNAARHDE